MPYAVILRAEREGTGKFSAVFTWVDEDWKFIEPADREVREFDISPLIEILQPVGSPLPPAAAVAAGYRNPTR